MTTTSPWDHRTVEVEVVGAPLVLDSLVVNGPGAPVLFLDGFGSTKEDHADFVRFPGLAGRPFIAYDAPGFGRSPAPIPSLLSIPYLVEVAETVLAALDVEQFHLVGHSMGGLTALLLAERHRDRVLSFVDIEGNLAPEDCFLSRQIVTHTATDPQVFLDQFAARTHPAGEYGSALYASNVHAKVDPRVVRGIFETMVDLSDNGDLLDRYLQMPFPRVFMHGEQNQLSYLPTLRGRGVEVAEIHFSGHWPMYSNAVAMWTTLARVYERHDRGPCR